MRARWYRSEGAVRGRERPDVGAWVAGPDGASMESARRDPMQTCSQCGASAAEEDGPCPSCGAARDVVRGDEPPRLSVVRSPVDPERAAGSHDEGDDDATSVPAGTWAGATDSDTPPVPFGDADSRKMRRITADETGGSDDRPDSRPDAMRPARRVRVDSGTRGRARGLVVAATAEETEPTPTSDTQRKQARVVAFPSAAATSGASPSGVRPGAEASASASSSGMRANVSGEIASPGGPPRWLASEILREKLPAEPYGWTSRAVAVVAGVGGALAAALLGGESGTHLGVAALLAAIAMGAMVPVPFAMRAGAFALLGSIGLAIATMARSTGAGTEIEGLATMGITLLAAAQLLRSVHRTSKFARAAMLVGIVVTASWLALAGGLGAMVVHGTTVEAWLGPLVRALLLVVLALSTLAFLDDTGDSGCSVWPWLVLGWSALDAVVAIALGTAESDIAAAATPLFATIAALGWMQVWATTPGLGREPGRARLDG